MVEQNITYENEWIPGHPPDDCPELPWWTWDGEYIFLAIWRKDMNSWESIESLIHIFRPEKVTHYHGLIEPAKPSKE
jgi:hypothetical protein